MKERLELGAMIDWSEHFLLAICVYKYDLNSSKRGAKLALERCDF
jgi:hypothetical protein